jgi:hypothetical protein
MFVRSWWPIAVGLVLLFGCKKSESASAAPGTAATAATAATTNTASAYPKAACKADDVKDCEAKCASDNPSCGVAGYLKFKAGDVKGALPLLSKACEEGAPNYCLTLAQIENQDNGGIKANPAAALKAFEKGCEGGIGKACQQIAPFYWDGKGGVAKDDKKALEYLLKGCNLGWAEACGFAAHEYHDTKRDAEALKLANQGCSGNDPESCVMTGQLNPDRNAALAIYTKLCTSTKYKKACDFQAMLEKPAAPAPTNNASNRDTASAPPSGPWNPEKDKCDDKIAHDKLWAWCDDRECRRLDSFNNCGKCDVACHSSSDVCKPNSYGDPKCFSDESTWYDP